MKKKKTENRSFETQLWEAACELWGHIPATEYRQVIIGLIFLRYVSDAFDKQYQKLVADGDGFENDPDAYRADNVFFVPTGARWQVIADKAHTPEIGMVIDDAMRAIEKILRSKTFCLQITPIPIWIKGFWVMSLTFLPI